MAESREASNCKVLCLIVFSNYELKRFAIATHLTALDLYFLLLK